MCGAKEELTKNWLMKAKRDLLSAEELAGADIHLKGPGYFKPFFATAEHRCSRMKAEINGNRLSVG